MIHLLACISLIFTAMLDGSCPLGALQPVIGSPVRAGSAPYTVAYSPIISGNLFVAAVNSAANSVSVYQENDTIGSLTEVPGSPFDVGTQPRFGGFSPIINGNGYLTVSNRDDNTFSVFTVNPTTGFLTEIAGSPFTSQGNEPFALAYSPLLLSNILFLAATNFTDNTISIYSVNQTTGALAAVGTATSVGSDPSDVAFSPLIGSNLFLAIACTANTNNLFIYKVNIVTGALTQVGSSLTAGSFPLSIAFSPLVSGNLFAAVVNNGSGTISTYQVDTTTGVFTPIATIGTGGINPISIAFSPLVDGNLFAAVTNNDSNSIALFQVDTNTGVFTAVTGSPFTATLNAPFWLSFSPLLPGGLFLSATNQGPLPDTISTFQVNLGAPTITTSSLAIVCPINVTINATINCGVPPFTVTWSDGLVQTIDSFTVSRIVTPQTTTQYQIISVVDSNETVTGPSNTITITVVGGPCCH